MNLNKELKLAYSYDIDVDAMYINVAKDYGYNQSIEFEFGIIMDFDTNGTPVALEIFDFSRLFGFDKYVLKNIKNIGMKINVDCCISLDLEVGLQIENEMVQYDLKKIAANYQKFPKMRYSYSIN